MEITFFSLISQPIKYADNPTQSIDMKIITTEETKLSAKYSLKISGIMAASVATKIALKYTLVKNAEIDNPTIFFNIISLSISHIVQTMIATTKTVSGCIPSRKHT